MKKLSMLLFGSLRLWRYLVCYLRCLARKNRLRIKSDIYRTSISDLVRCITVLKYPYNMCFQQSFLGQVQRLFMINNN